MTTQIKRKPLPQTASSIVQYSHHATQQDGRGQSLDAGANSDVETCIPVAPPFLDGELRPELDEQLEQLDLHPSEGGCPSIEADVITAQNATWPDDLEPTSQTVSKFKAAFEEVKHFAGGLISHPYEATKHYTILRHSHGLVYYQGPTTSVAITVFSDRPLPLGRTLWLQKRGYSGNTGMKLGTLGNRNAWVDVTPSLDASPELLPKSDERAWQRDISKFLRKAKDAKHLSKHRPYETDVVRIPHVADDGYFRIVLCDGRKVLCPSPVFRYASTSLDPSTLRGASLSTLPLELGIRIGSIVANRAASAATQGAMQPAINTLQNVTQPYQLDGVTQWAATTAYESSGAADRVNKTIGSINSQYDERQNLALDRANGEPFRDGILADSDDGPESPYPIRFSGKAAQGFDKLQLQWGKLTIELVRAPENILLRLSGFYMAWCSLSKPKASKSSESAHNGYDVWLPAIVAMTPIRDRQVKVVQQKAVFAHLLQDPSEVELYNAKLNVMLMAFLHPSDTALPTVNSEDDIHHERVRNLIETTTASLRRPAWSPQAVIERLESESNDRSFTQRVADARQSGQAQLDRGPTHRLGIRTESMGLKDQLIGVGGLCVRR